MNRVYKLVWSKRLNALIAVGENSRSRGKNNQSIKTNRKAISSAVAGALLAVSGSPALADLCGSGVTSVTTAITNDRCTLNATGEGLNVSSTGSISINGNAVEVEEYPGILDIFNDGTISGGDNGVLLGLLGPQMGTITNNGLLEGVNKAGIVIDGFEGGNLLSINNVGVLTGVTNGILIRDGGIISGGLTNSGTISATGSSAVMGLHVVGGGSSINGGVTNSGTITANGSTAAAGIAVEGQGKIQGGINNSGLITSNRDGIWLSQGEIADGISNNGVILGVEQGIELYWATLSGGITNLASGTISGFDGILMGGNENTGSSFAHRPSTLSGGIANSGLIGGVNVGIHVIGSTFTGDISNSGTITGGTAIRFEPGFTGSTSSPTSVRGVFNGSILNSGVISSNNNAVAIEIVETDISGSLTNSVTGTISGDEGIRINSAYIAQDIKNSGSIVGAQNGLNITGGEVGASTIAGKIDNSGLISGGNNGNGITVSGGSTVTGGLINTGTINVGGAARGSAVRIEDSSIGSITNEASSTMIGGATSGAGLRFGSNATVNGDVVNKGLIQGGSQGEYLRRVAISGEVNNNAGATIVGQSGMTLERATITGGIHNSGVITGDGNHAIYATLSTISAIENLSGGTISGSGVGIDISSTSTISGHILNAQGGVIHGGSAGVVIGISSTVAGGLTNHGIISGPSSIILNPGAAPIIVDNDGTLAGDVNISASTLNLNGSTGRVIGNVTATGGTVNINGLFTSEGTFNTGTFNVASAATFNMAHDVTATTFNNNGTVKVTANGSAYNVTGDYNQAANAFFKTTLTDTTSNYGKLAVSGNATLVSGTGIDVNVSGSPTLSNNLRVPDVIKAGGTLTNGTINVTDNSYLFNFSADTSRDPKAVDLIITAAQSEPETPPTPEAPPTTETPPTPEPEPQPEPPKSVVTAVTQNSNSPGLGAARVLDNFVVNGTSDPDMQQVIGVLGTFSTNAEISNAVQQMLPVLTGAGTAATNNALHSMNRIIQSRIENNRGLSSGEDFYGNNQVWFKPFYSKAKQDNRDEVMGFDSHTAGLAVGLDGVANDRTRVGIVFTYADSSVSNNGNVRQHVDVGTYELVGYASYNLDPVTDINYQIDVGYNTNDAERSINFGSINRKATADYGSWSGHASVGIGRLYKLSEKTTITPSTRLDYTRVDTESYTEKGAGSLSLEVDSARYEELLASLDLKMTHELSDSVKVVGNLAVAYDFINEDAQSTSAYVGGGATFLTSGLDPSPVIGRVGLGVVKTTGNGMEYTLRYDAEGRDTGFLNQTISARLRMPF